MKVNGKEVSALIDSGASISVVKKSVVDPCSITKGKTVQVQGYDGQQTCYDTWAEPLICYLDQHIRVKALVIDNIQYDMLLARPDMKKLRLNIYWNDHVSTDLVANSAESSSPRLVVGPSDIPEKYPELFPTGTYPPATTFLEVPFTLHNTTVIQKKHYPMTRERKMWLKGELQNMLDAKIIRPSTSTFASPITVALKEDGSLRLCTDYRALNQQTELFPYPMPRIDDVINETGGCSVFSRIDLSKGFWQVPLTEESKKYTAFTTPYGLYEYNRLPFGWKNSPAWFQKMMTEVLQPYLGVFCNVYIDDIVVYSKSDADHAKHLSLVLEALSNASLKLNFKKSAFFQRQVTFLGRVFDGFTKSTKAESIAKISELTKPYDVHSLRVFLGLAGHFRPFIRNYAQRTRCLTMLTQKSTPFVWTAQCEDAYHFLLESISTDPVLTIPDFSLPFELHTDASYYGTGAVLYQKNTSAQSRQQLQVIGYYSHTMTKPEINYSATEKEALAVLLALRHFRTFLDGRQFSLITDHSALVQLFRTAEPRDRLARWIFEIQQFDFDVSHRKGTLLTDADALSRLVKPSLPTHEINVAKLWEGTESLMLVDGVFQVPETLRTVILELYHDSPHSGGHDGFNRTYSKLTSRFSWPGMKKDVEKYVRSCHTCQIQKAKYKPKPDEMVLPTHSSTPFEVVHLDFAELKKKGEGVRRTQSFLIAVDECTRMIAARPGREDTNSVIVLMERQMFERTKVLVSDNAAAFKSNALQTWAAQRGVQLKYTSPYHPEANGLAERTIRSVKQYMSMYPNFKGGWKCCLEAAVAHHNRSSSAALGCSPLCAFTGKPTLLPADSMLEIHDKLTLNERKKTPEQQQLYRNTMKRNFDKRHVTSIPPITVGDAVMIWKGLPGQQQHLTGPFPVIKTASKCGVLKTIGYTNADGNMEVAAIKNALLYHPRRGGLEK